MHELYSLDTGVPGRNRYTAYKTIAGALAAATAGTTVLIHGGSYNDPLIPQNSEAAGQYIPLLIDAGGFLAKTAETKINSTSMRVDDAAYFYDGYGIAGEQGDLIQLQEGTSTARIVAVDYTTRTFTLDRPLTWTAGQRVALQFDGNAPDVGVFETNLAPVARPTAPSGLRLTQP